jgi:acetylornithine deacetylase/succinyl-diaminopimelate desuccinylase-like protein
MRQFVGRLAEVLPRAQGAVLGQLLNPRLSGVILNVLGRKDPSLARSFSALLSNTASPTVLRGGSKTNVIPASASVELDGRTLPGQTAEDLVAELRAVLGHDLDPHVDIEIMRAAPPVVTEPVSPLMDTITDAVVRHDPGALVIPYLIPGFTDAKSFSRLGTRCYGFAPVRLPEDGPAFSSLFHGHDERIPVEGLRWGAEVLYDVVRSFCAA